MLANTNTRRLVILVLAVLLFGAARPALAQDAQVQTIEISQVDDSNFPEMTVYVRLLDANRQTVPNLLKENFSITEDGKPVQITAFAVSNNQPVATLLLIDVSGSMNESNKIGAARDAAASFVDLMRADDQMAVWVFNHSVQKVAAFTSDRAALKTEIRAIRAHDGTAWYDAVVEASADLQQQGGRKSLLLLSDGQDNDSRNSFQRASEAALDAQCPVYTIGLGYGAEIDATRLQRLANETGGAFYQAPDGAALQALYAQVSQSTRDEYVITYTSPRSAQDGTRRDIQITIGGASSTATYAEAHLLNIQADPLVALLAALPLLGLLVGPGLARRLAGMRKPWRNKPVPQPAAPIAIESFCDNCGSPVKEGARFCAVCGTASPAVPPAAAPQASPPVAVAAPPNQPAPKFCKTCGHPVRSGVQFCSQCGARFK